MHAIHQLRQCVTEAGVLASPDDAHNYRRVWARDGIISALGALAGDVDDACDWLHATLTTLAQHQGPVGQIPSNVALGDDDDVQVSYGGNAVRIDATLWFMVGVGVWHRLQDDVDEQLISAAVRGRAFIRCWEGNERRLLYIPRAGNWADEYPVLGYTLYDNSLRVWAESEVDGLVANADDDKRVFDYAIVQALVDEHGPLAYVGPGERCRRFCGFGAALAALLDVGQRKDLFLDVIEQHVRHNLVPAFWPPIDRGEPDYTVLEHLAAYGMRNTPGRYHNGGLWPVVSGFAAAAARRHGRDELADHLAQGVDSHNAAGDFPEFVDVNDRSAGGTLHMAWSAAASLWAHAGQDRLQHLLSR